jgi:hypothetical protein
LFFSLLLCYCLPLVCNYAMNVLSFDLQKKVATVSSMTSVLADMIQPAKDPIGKRLMRAMGWREGKEPRQKAAGAPPPPTARSRKVYPSDDNAHIASCNLSPFAGIWLQYY